MSHQVSREEDNVKKRTGKRRTARKSTKSARSARARTKKARARAPAKSRSKAVRKREVPRRKKASVKKTKKASVKKMRAPKTSARRAPMEVLGEGNYTAAGKFRQDETRFVQRNRNKIAGLGQAAEAALDGDERTSLENAATRAAAHRHSPGEDI
jgi:hypothetical protein